MRYSIIVVGILFLFSNNSCKKCECTGDKTQIIQEYRDLFTLKTDTTITFVKNKTDTIVFYTNYIYQEEKPKVGFSNIPHKTCICPEDYYIYESYIQKTNDQKLEFGIYAQADKLGSSYSYFLSYDKFEKFDSTNLTRIINSKSISGLKLKSFSDRPDSIKEIYYKENLGLVFISYFNGDSIYLGNL